MAATQKVQIPNHAHCWMCGRAIPHGEKTCSDECQAGYEQTQKKRRQMMWIMYGAMGFAAILIIGQLMGYG